MIVALVISPFSIASIEAALAGLKVAPLIAGFRGRPKGDLGPAIDAVMAVADYAEANRAHLVELDVNPLLVLPEGKGAVAVDALIRLNG